jgi:hypothetical protein
MCMVQGQSGWRCHCPHLPALRPPATAKSLGIGILRALWNRASALSVLWADALCSEYLVQLMLHFQHMAS